MPLSAEFCRFLVRSYSVLQNNALANGTDDDLLNTDEPVTGNNDYHDDSDEVQINSHQ